MTGYNRQMKPLVCVFSPFLDKQASSSSTDPCEGAPGNNRGLNERGSITEVWVWRWVERWWSLRSGGLWRGSCSEVMAKKKGEEDPLSLPLLKQWLRCKWCRRITGNPSYTPSSSLLSFLAVCLKIWFDNENFYKAFIRFWAGWSNGNGCFVDWARTWRATY